jgi:non-canonical (house-cleaning) NTP pyrophosphatase
MLREVEPMLIAIGSLNPVKIHAAERVLQPLFPHAKLRPVQASSGVPEQPWGETETRTGAINRAQRHARLPADLALA